MTLDDRQVDLFSRQVLLREVGGKGQERLLASRVLVTGAGPAAETAATYLAGAGVGTLGTGGGGVARGAFVPLAERCPDARVIDVGALRGIDLSDWDVLVEMAGGDSAGREGESDGGGGNGLPRLGFVAVSFAAGGGATLLIVPSRAAGCTKCHDVGTSADANGSPPSATSRAWKQEAVDLLLAGDLAAQATLLLLLDLDVGEAPRAFRLKSGAPAFETVPVPRRTPCPRGCRV